MKTNQQLEIFLITAPGFEQVLCDEAQEKGFKRPEPSLGGVTVWGDWKDVWRANLILRGASRVLVRLGSFPANHLAKLDKKSRKFPWDETFRADIPVRVDVTCKKSRIYHSKAAAQRIETALTEEFGIQISSDAELCIKVRIFNDQCTISVDTSGEALHKRGHKEAVSKAPMRENLAALILRHAGYVGSEPVIDPMCGSGTFVIEAAEIATGLAPGRSRNFAFEKLLKFNKDNWQHLKEQVISNPTTLAFYGFDRNIGAIAMSIANAERAGVSSQCHFNAQSISDLTEPEGEKGLIVINPPYGGRIGDEKKLFPLYQTMGKTLRSNFKGWRVAIVTSSARLAKSTGLPFEPKPLVFSHGGTNVKLFKIKELL